MKFKNYYGMSDNEWQEALIDNKKLTLFVLSYLKDEQVALSRKLKREATINDLIELYK